MFQALLIFYFAFEVLLLKEILHPGTCPKLSSMKEEYLGDKRSFKLRNSAV